MPSFILLIFLFILFAMYCKLSIRVRKCEEDLRSLKHPSQKEEPSILKVDEHPSYIKAEEPSEGASLEPYNKAAIASENLDDKLQPVASTGWFKISNILKDNWMGFFGSVALVLGTVFFGLTADIMQLPEARVGLMIAVSLLLFGLSQRLKNMADWAALSGWMNSIGGAIILFATLGAGYVQGLQFIESPLTALGFLSLGILVNIFLSAKTSSQGVASLHVVLSFITLWVIPQSIILLPLATLLAVMGLVVAARSKWDLLLALTVVAFSNQTLIWTYDMQAQMEPWMNSSMNSWMNPLAIGCSLIVGLFAASLHYSEKYRSPLTKPLPLIAHVLNWVLLAFNISQHAHLFTGTPLILTAVALSGFILSRLAKKREIYWLFYTDTLASQIVLMFAVASLEVFSINNLDLALVTLSTTFIFNFVWGLKNEDYILRIGYILQYIVYILAFKYVFEYWDESEVRDFYPIYWRVGTIALFSWIFHLVASQQKLRIDDYKFILFNEKEIPYPVSMTALFGTVFLMELYFIGSNSVVIQTLTLVCLVLVALWKKYKEKSSLENATWSAVLFLYLMFVNLVITTLFAGSRLLQLLGVDRETAMSAISRVDSMGIIIVNSFLIGGNFLQFTRPINNIRKMVIYLLGFQVAVYTLMIVSLYYPALSGMTLLGLSLGALIFSHTASRLSRFNEELIKALKQGMTELGLAFLIVFLCGFILGLRSENGFWPEITLAGITKIFGLLTLLSWIVYFPKDESPSRFTRFCQRNLIGATLIFVTLTVIKEIPIEGMALAWILLALFMLVGSLNFKCPKRLFIYSWVYFIVSVLFLTVISNKTSALYNSHNLLACLAISFQFIYAYLTCKRAEELKKIGDVTDITRHIPKLYANVAFTVILPLFLGIAILFGNNFEKTLLTLLWVGLTCLYFAAGLFIQSKRTVQFAMGALAFFAARLISFDYVQTDLATRALVFIGVGGLMLGLSVLYKKYKYRIDRF